ncbi:MAG: AMP-binding protein, partial [Singulisphaera sp.]|nr:AMP-binding protein [Singulisphaera sp.]
DRRRERLVGYFRDRVAGVLRLEPDRLDPERPLNSLGLDSLMAMELRNAIESELGALVPLTSFLEGPSIAQLTERVLVQWSSQDVIPGTMLAPAAETVSESPLSPNQQSLWYLHQATELGAAYQIAGAARVRSALDAEALGRSLRRLAGRHPALRSSFIVVGGRPVQRVREAPEVEFRVEEVPSRAVAEVERLLSDEARRPFDLERGPLLRVVVFRRAPEDHYVLLMIHHVISDFWSIGILVDELGRLYDQERTGASADLPRLELQYTDFVRWQTEMLAGPEGERLWAYWRTRLAGPLPDLNLPTDRPRPSIQTQRGASRHLHLDERLSKRVTALGEAQGASLYTTLLAAFQVLLGRYSGQDDVIVGSPVSGRTRPGLDNLVGYFVNLLPMRADLSANPPFTEFLHQVRQAVHGALEHQDFPLPLMIQRLQPDRDPSRSPVFQVMFIHQKGQRLDEQGLTPFALFESGPRMELAGLPLESVALDKNTALFDLTLTAARSDGRLALALEYNHDLYDAPTIDHMLAHFRMLLESIVSRPEERIADLPLLTEAERCLVLDGWGAAPAPPRPDLCVHQLFERQTRRAPDAVAVVLGEQRLTYRELDARADRLARRLRELGVGPDVLVGLCLERSPELLVGLLAVLKACGAYVPFDPSYPDGRLACILQEARLPLLITRRADFERLSHSDV